MRKNNNAAELDGNRAACRARRLNRFAPLFRDRVAALTCCAPQAEDLADSFPGLLVALVSNVGTVEQRAAAFNTILSGGSLRLAAQQLALPLWLRKMPPEAFRGPIRQLPGEDQFTAKISNFIPEKAHIAGDWLEQVSFAGEACHSGFALWVAKHCGSVAPSRRRLVFLYMASWAWHSNHPETIGYRLIDRPWSPKMGLRRAMEELMRWRRRVDLACLLGDGIESVWLSGGHHGGYDFVPLVTLDDFLHESKAMHNCLDQYADRMATGLIRIFSIRQDGTPVADIEIGPTPAKSATPSIVQIKATKNRQPPLAIWQAAHQWLDEQDLETLPRRPGAVRTTKPPHSVEPFWRPYLDWLPEGRRTEFEKCIINTRRRATRSHLPHPAVDLGSPAQRTTDVAR
ncbi:MAG: PcfJ domain-containing protein [Hyphomicrobiaceae bacterium]